MSGGVDSSLSAYLLKEAGYDVTGVFIRVWQPEGGNCGWKDERRDAMCVAAKLDIPFQTLDFSDKYKEEVVDYMISEYKAGRTPNPDVMCNRHVKFGSFLQEALKQGADYVATGHYAKNIYSEKTGEKAGKKVGSGIKGRGAYELYESDDKNKDQSYFLWTLTQKDLQNVLFPIGHLQKSEVRAIAERAGLPVFDKKDSQGVCFIGHLDMKEFLREHIKVKKGKVLDSEGKVIGEHDGAALYTEGERHGFTIFNIGNGIDGVGNKEKNIKSAKNKGTHTEPHYIILKNIQKNTITAVPESAIKQKLNEQTSDTIGLANVSWVRGTPDLTKKYEARIRYRQEKQTCTLEKIQRKSGSLANSFRLVFDKPQKGMAEGQSAVIYDGEVCVGGGILWHI